MSPLTGQLCRNRLHGLDTPITLVCEVLQAQQERQSERCKSDDVIAAVMEQPLFTRPDGRPLDPNDLWREIFYEALAAAGIRRVRFHDARHTFASLLLQQGESLTYVRDQLGHSSIQKKGDVYGHLVPGLNRQAVDKLDDPILLSVGQTGATS